MKRLALDKICIVFMCLLLWASSSLPFIVQARTIDEINQDIQKTQDELNKLKADLDAANKELANTQSQKNSTNSELNKVRTQIAEIDQTIRLNELKSNELASMIQLKQFEKEQTEKLQDNQIVNSYINWKIDDYTNSVFINSEDVFKNVIYYEFMTKETEKGIVALGQELEVLNKTSLDYQKQTQDLQAQVLGLNEKKVFWENQVKLYEQSLANAKANQNALKANSSQLENQNKSLNDELEKAVAEINSGSQPLVPGETFFTGSLGHPTEYEPVCTNSGGYGIDPGTDSLGHGIGMSQYGAYGAASKGWSAEKIVTYYYPNTALVTKPAVNIFVKGSWISMEDYVSGLGEVASYACGTVGKIDAWQQQADSLGWSPTDPRRNKYVIDNPNTMWDCWPEESIKAQVIAARTYAYNRTNSMCTTDRCQVYVGGNAKAWAAWETKDQVITYQGQVIDAFYSAFNSNGWGNADIDTVWVGSSPKAYLSSVYDGDFTLKPTLCGHSYYREDWNTNTYSISDFTQMLAWASNSSEWSDYNGVEYSSGCYTSDGRYAYNACVVRKKITNVIGNLTSISLTRDGSGRVKRVNFTGTNGQGSVSGIFFRMMFNSWAGRTNRNDALKSITFNIAVAP